MAEYEFHSPLRDKDIQLLNVGDVLFFTGELYTLRDMAYERVLNTIREGDDLPFDLMGQTIWHCGPIVKQEGGKWYAVSVGSTTSSRFTYPAAQVLERLGVKMIMGKGFMGKEIIPFLSRHKAVYAVTTGGAAAYYADRVEEVKDVHWLELGMPSAVWVLKVKKMGPLIVGMDSKGGSIFDEVASKVESTIDSVYREFGIRSDHRYVWWP